MDLLIGFEARCRTGTSRPLVTLTICVSGKLWAVVCMRESILLRASGEDVDYQGMRVISVEYRVHSKSFPGGQRSW
jgi:hypothetical protein